jgi:diguanylate cyclase (GGDEF)-like protein
MQNTPHSPSETLSVVQRQASELEDIRQRCERAESALEAIQQRNQVLGASAPFGILTIDPQGRVTGMNLKMREMLPWPPHVRLEALNIFEFDALIEAGVIDDFRRCWQSKQTIIRDYSCVQDQKRCRQLRFHLSPIADDTDKFSGVMAFVENHTNLKQAQDAARESEERYRLLFQSAPVPMIERDVSEMKAHLVALRQSGVSDLRAHFRLHPEEIERCLEMVKTVDCNDAFLRLLETRDKHAVLAKMPRFIVDEGFLQMAEESILIVDQGTPLPEREMTIETLQGNRKRIMSQYMVLPGDENTLSRVVISLVDITKRVEAEEALRASEQRFREQSLRDNLTGLQNRRFLYQSLPGLIQSARYAQTCLSLLFMDMDNFKSVVDAHGHLNGSRAIKEVGETIRAAIEPPSYAVAYAGDEFVVVLPNHSRHEAGQKATQIQSQIKATAYLSSQGKAVRLQASCGIASFPTDADDPEGLLAAADAALFAVKVNGKGALCHYAELVSA